MVVAGLLVFVHSSAKLSLHTGTRPHQACQHEFGKHNLLLFNVL
jgi:uncharacterized protein YhhL (DUF1145 family)